MAAEQDVEVDDDLAQAQRNLRELKTKISAQSKKNFMLERDVRFLDSRIALLIQNRMALDEHHEIDSHVDHHDDNTSDHYPDDRKMQQYSNLFFLLQWESRHIATLCRLVSLSEIDNLLQTVMFTLYGNQYESREEHLLLTMFQNVLAAQFETTPEFTSLLRANTPVSRMLTTYTRRGPGQTYLKSILSHQIHTIIEQKDINLQINPLKVYEEILEKAEQAQGTLPPQYERSITAEAAAANPEVQSIIKPRITALITIAEAFLTIIIDSLGHVPYGIRWICKQIRSLAKRKYPDASDSAISSLIGGFFLLRFINPAIVTPQAYMLIDDLPDEHPRTTLTLIAKMLQNLANKPVYAKEAYMIPTNVFIERNKKRMNQFFNSLCEVGDFYDSLEMDQYMALSKKNIIINITLNEIYNMQSLLYKHVDILAPRDTDHLRILLNEIGPPPPQLPRQDNKPIELPLFSRWDTPIQDLTTTLMSENNVTQNDILYIEAKFLLVQILRHLPSLTGVPLDLHYIAEAAASSKDPLLVRKGIKIKETLHDLEKAGVVDERDHYQLLAEEVLQEIDHLGDLKDIISEEIHSLEIVYQSILDHNNYLRGQLESYKAYLQNVRIQSGGGGDKANKKQVGLGVEVAVGKPSKKLVKPSVQGPFKFTHQQLERDGVIAGTDIPEYRRNNIFITISSPTPGTFIIAIHYKGRDKPILEIDLKLDDLLEKQQDSIEILDLEYIKLDVSKILQLLSKTFISKTK
ncbi:Rho GTPase activation protein [Radiomyces spectabilis]|uniref:Rho GTPase activation protein n=1 Tax=Radiomyces spectabilis TaxID=64574 RepID=UPI00221E41EF|nr:Rho GTPase activation protein [Radiomyces spectabilis]KAI8368200.1 Rho GTPase activation protein [Radiomyces spectabilis]